MSVVAVVIDTNRFTRAPMPTVASTCVDSWPTSHSTCRGVHPLRPRPSVARASPRRVLFAPQLPPPASKPVSATIGSSLPSSAARARANLTPQARFSPRARETGTMIAEGVVCLVVGMAARLAVPLVGRFFGPFLRRQWEKNLEWGMREIEKQPKAK